MKDQKEGDLAGKGESVSRRSFLKRSSLAPLAGFLGTADAMPLRFAPDPRPPRPSAESVRCGIIGFGPQGREIAGTLGRIPDAEVAAVCDTYGVMLKRAERATPGATLLSDYRAMLDDASVPCVFVATPTHLHRDIVLDALQAGKHVYCEAPMASTIADAQAMAKAARDANERIFQVGQLYRSDPQHRNVFQFIRSGAIGTPTMVRAQWHRKESWRRASPNAEREAEINWRLDADKSLGLIGEEALQQLDAAFRILQALPVSVSGFGQIQLWDDGRTVPDTVQALFAFPRGVHLMYHATLTSSFDSAYEIYHGNDSTIMMRDSKAWMFKEVDAPMLGWEVYARKDTFYKEQGVALVADATKLAAQGLDPAADDPNVETALFYALQEFLDNNSFGPYPPNADYQVGLNAVVVAAKANEAIVGNKTIEIDPELFVLGE